MNQLQISVFKFWYTSAIAAIATIWQHIDFVLNNTLQNNNLFKFRYDIGYMHKFKVKPRYNFDNHLNGWSSSNVWLMTFKISVNYIRRIVNVLQHIAIFINHSPNLINHVFEPLPSKFIIKFVHQNSTAYK